jgi:hypothetical protein
VSPPPGGARRAAAAVPSGRAGGEEQMKKAAANYAPTTARATTRTPRRRRRGGRRRTASSGRRAWRRATPEPAGAAGQDAQIDGWIDQCSLLSGQAMHACARSCFLIRTSIYIVVFVLFDLFACALDSVYKFVHIWRVKCDHA